MTEQAPLYDDDEAIEYEAAISALGAENNMLFHRAAVRLARIKELEAALATSAARIAELEQELADYKKHSAKLYGIIVARDEALLEDEGK